MRPNPQRIIDITNAFFDSCALFAASDAGIFAKLAEAGEADAERLAAALGLNPRAAGLLLDACVAIGLLEKAGTRYRNTPEAAVFLTPGSPGDLSKAILYNRDVLPAWSKLSEFVRLGRPVESPWLHLGDDAQRTRNFVHSMHHRALAIGRCVVPELQLANCRHLLDVGGGPGTYAVLITAAHPEMRATVLDLPPIVAIASDLIKAQGAAERISVLPGDYRTTPFPEGIDAINFFGMLHQESPDSIRDLLHRAYEALEPGGIVHVMDMMTNATHTQPKYSALFAVNMALTTENGWVFSDEELKQWMSEAGFSGFRVKPLPPPMPHWLASGVKLA